MSQKFRNKILRNKEHEEIMRRLDTIQSFERHTWNRWRIKETQIACRVWLGKISWENIETEDEYYLEEVFELCPPNAKDDLIFNINFFVKGGKECRKKKMK
jgi:hypothetical protein